MTRMPRWLPLRPVFLLALLLLLSVLLTACGQRETAALPGTPATATTARVAPAASLTPSTAVAATAVPTSVPSTQVETTMTPAPPTATSVPPTPVPPTATAAPAADVLVAERTMGAWTVRTYQPAPGTGMYNYLTLSSQGRPDTRVDNVARTLEPPVPDVTGDGHPDLWIETRTGGSRCCWGTVVYSLAPELNRVLEITMAPDYYGTGTGGFQDLDGDGGAGGAFEFLTSDPVAGVPCSGPTVMVVLRYEPGRGYVGAGPRYPEAYASAIEAHTRRAETQIDLTRDGYKCDVYQVIADYLYAGQPERARQELERLYLGADRDAFWADFQAAIAGGRFYVTQ